MRKFIIYKYSVIPTKALTAEETYVLKEIRSDHKLQEQRIMLLALFSKCILCWHGARFIFNVVSGAQFQLMTICALMCLFPLEKFNQLYMSPRIGHYLRLMQLGPDFKLTVDT